MDDSDARLKQIQELQQRMEQLKQQIEGLSKASSQPKNGADPAGTSTAGLPSKAQLIDRYKRFKDQHPRNLLKLESEIPPELCYEARDPYRIIMTMILSQGTDDYSLTESLGQLFKACPDMGGLKGLPSEGRARALLKSYDFKVDGKARYNVDRFWGFISMYFHTWNRTIPSNYIETLRAQSKYGQGYGNTFRRKLQAYHMGEKNVLPLDTPGFKFLQRRFPGAYNNIAADREDIEKKLRSEPGISLIDFHEMLRYRGQAGFAATSSDVYLSVALLQPREADRVDKIIIGWNAWRLLCLRDRSWITQEWIYGNLVKDQRLAKDLWEFFLKVK